MTVFQDPFLDQMLDQRKEQAPPVAVGQSDESEDPLLDDIFKTRTEAQAWTPENLTPEMLADFKSKFPEILRGKNNEEAAQIAAFHFQNPGGVVAPPPRESFGQSVLKAPARLAGGVIDTLTVQPVVSMHEGFATLAAIAGNKDLSEAFKQAARETTAEASHGLITQFADDGGVWAGLGHLGGNIGPSALAIMSSGPFAPVLLWYAVQAFGSKGAEIDEYRALYPQIEISEWDKLFLSVGSAVVEVVTEKLGLDFLGRRIGAGVYKKIGEQFIAGDMKGAVALMGEFTLVTQVNAAEEVLAEVSNNAMAGHGLPGVTAFDPGRSLLAGTDQAYWSGVGGGAMLMGSAFFAKPARFRMPATKAVEAGLQDQHRIRQMEERQARNGLVSFMEGTGLDQIEMVIESTRGLPVVGPSILDEVEGNDADYVFPHEFEAIDPQERAEAIGFLSQSLSTGIDPSTGQVLTQEQRVQRASMLESMLSRDDLEDQDAFTHRIAVEEDLDQGAVQARLDQTSPDAQLTELPETEDPILRLADQTDTAEEADGIEAELLEFRGEVIAQDFRDRFALGQRLAQREAAVTEQAKEPVTFVGAQEGTANVPGFDLVNLASGTTARFDPARHRVTGVDPAAEEGVTVPARLQVPLEPEAEIQARIEANPRSKEELQALGVAELRQVAESFGLTDLSGADKDALVAGISDAVQTALNPQEPQTAAQDARELVQRQAVESEPEPRREVLRLKTPDDDQQGLLDQVSAKLSQSGTDLGMESVVPAQGSAQARIGDSLLQATGTEILYFKPTGELQTPVRGINASDVLGRRILVNSEVADEDSLIGVVSHEIIHDLEQTRQLEKFQNAIQRIDPIGLRRAGENYARDLGLRDDRAINRFLATKRGRNESLARYVEENGQRFGFWQRLTSERPSLTRRLRDILDRFVGFVKGGDLAKVVAMRDLADAALSQKSQMESMLAEGVAFAVGDDFTQVAEGTIAMAAQVKLATVPEMLEQIDEIISSSPPQIRRQREFIRRNALRLIARSRVGDKLDPAKFELEAAELRDKAAARAQRASGPIKGRIREATRGPRGRQISEERALKAQLFAEQRGSVAAQRAGVKQERSAIRSALRQAQKDVRIDARRVQAAKDTLKGMVRENLPRALHVRMLSDITKIQSVKGMTRAIRKMGRLLDQQQRTETLATLKKEINKVDVDKLRPQYRQAMLELIGDVGVRGMSGKTQQRLESLATFIAANPDAADRIPQSQLDQLSRLSQKPINDFTTEEAEAMINAIGLFNKLNSLHNRLVQRGKLRERDRLSEEVAGEVLGRFQPRKILPSGRRAPEGRQTIWTLPFSLEGVMKPDLYGEYLGGSDSATTWQVLFGDVEEGWSEMLRGYQNSMDVLHDAIEGAGLALGSQELGLWSADLAGEIGLWRSLAQGDVTSRRDTRAETLSHTLRDGTELQFTRAERMSLIATLRRATTFDQVVFDEVQVVFGRQENPFTLTFDDITDLEQLMSAQEKTIVDASMEEINGPMKQAMRDWSIRHNGFDITEEGDYYPRHRRRRGAEPEDLSRSRSTQQVLEKAGITQPTGRSKDPFEIRDFFIEYSNLSWTNYAVTELSEPIRTARSVLRTDAVDQALTRTRGRRAIQYWDRVYDEMARSVLGGPKLQGPISQAGSQAINNLTRGLLALNPRVIMYQPASFMLAATEIPSEYLMKAVMDTAFLDESIDQEILDGGSPQLRARFESSAMGIINEGSGQGRLLKFSDRGDRFMRGIHFADRMAIRGIWAAARNQVDAEMSELQGADRMAAIRKIADRTVTRTQPVWDPLHSSGIALEGRRNAAVKALTMFMSQRNQNVNILYRSGMRAIRDPSTVLEQGRNMGLVVVGQGLMIMAIKELWDWVLRGFKEDDEPTVKKWASRWIDITAGNFYFGNFVSHAMNRILFPDIQVFQPDMSPVTGTVVDVFGGLVKMGRNFDPTSREFWEGTERSARAFSALAGIPTFPIRIGRDVIFSVWDEEQADRAAPREQEGARPSRLRPRKARTK